MQSSTVYDVTFCCPDCGHRLHVSVPVRLDMGTHEVALSADRRTAHVTVTLALPELAHKLNEHCAADLANHPDVTLEHFR